MRSFRLLFKKTFVRNLRKLSSKAFDKKSFSWKLKTQMKHQTIAIFEPFYNSFIHMCFTFKYKLLYLQNLTSCNCLVLQLNIRFQRNKSIFSDLNLQRTSVFCKPRDACKIDIKNFKTSIVQDRPTKSFLFFFFILKSWKCLNC